MCSSDLPQEEFGLSRHHNGAREENRTPDLRITSALLYRLSYPGVRRNVSGAGRTDPPRRRSVRGSALEGRQLQQQGLQQQGRVACHVRRLREVGMAHRL